MICNKHARVVQFHKPAHVHPCVRDAAVYTQLQSLVMKNINVKRFISTCHFIVKYIMISLMNIERSRWPDSGHIGLQSLYLVVNINYLLKVEVASWQIRVAKNGIGKIISICCRLLDLRVWRRKAKSKQVREFQITMYGGHSTNTKTTYRPPLFVFAMSNTKNQTSISLHHLRTHTTSTDMLPSGEKAKLTKLKTQKVNFSVTIANFKYPTMTSKSVDFTIIPTRDPEHWPESRPFFSPEIPGLSCPNPWISGLKIPQST